MKAAANGGITSDGPLSLALEEQESTTLPGERAVTLEEQRLRDLILRRFLEMDNQYFTYWLPTHTEIVQFIWPNRSEFFQFETNKGYQRDLNIFDNSASIDGRKLTSFLDTCLTNEARTWFTITSEDPNDAERDDVAEYCHTVQAILFSILAASNFYPANRNVLDDLVGVATGALLIEGDDEEVVGFTHLPSGTYRTSTDAKGRNNRLARRFTFTAEQMVEEFGIERVSLSVKMAVSSNQTMQTPYQVIQVIEPRAVRDPSKKDAKILRGMIRAIERDSTADVAYDTGFAGYNNVIAQSSLVTLL